MRDPVGVRFMSTASHCPGSPWNHAGRAIGSTVWTQDSGRIDFKVIRENNQNEAVPTNWVYRDSTPTATITTKITNPNSSLVGNIVCLEGAVSDTSCGFVTSYNASYMGRSKFGQMSNTACHGDSGSPVINNSTLRAYGLQVGTSFLPGQDCGTPSFFTWVPYFESASGYQVLLTSTTEGLGQGQRMNADQYILSPNGLYKVIMQQDGNLVMYQSGGGAVWSTRTNNNPGSFAVMQNDGNLVVYRAGGGVAIWASGTGGNSGSRLIMQNDRNLVIYGTNGTASWASNTGV